MALTREEILADLKKVKVRTYMYLGAAVLLAMIAVALVISYYARTPHDVAALLLAGAAVIFTGIMVNQTIRTKKLADLISGKLAEGVKAEATEEPSEATGSEGKADPSLEGPGPADRAEAAEDGRVEQEDGPAGGDADEP